MEYNISICLLGIGSDLTNLGKVGVDMKTKTDCETETSVTASTSTERGPGPTGIATWAPRTAKAG
jgi:hypothetical protein